MTNEQQPIDERDDQPGVAYPSADYQTAEAGSGFEFPHPSPTGPGGWTFLDVAMLLIIAIPAQLLAVAICVSGLQVYEWLTGVEIVLPATLGEAPVIVAIQVLWWAFLIAFIYGVITIRHRLPFLPAIGWRPVSQPPTAYLLGGVLLAVSVAVVAYLLPPAPGRMPIQDLLDDRNSLVILAFYGVLFAPVVEELVFRGFLYATLERARGPVVAVLITSVVFSLPHAWQYGWRWQNLLLVTYVGVMFGIARARTQSVVPSTLLHVGYNGTLFVGLFATGDKLFAQ